MKRRDAHNQLRDVLLDARRKKGLTQVEVATLLEKPQSFVSKYESGERRLDIIEFLEVCKALKVNPATIIQQLEIDGG
ncbi:MAG: helix-turn-helix transcriptional regulator [Anaerolineae bacterium]|nr:helix-turn-helix transcriptional regulator [Anaerolineae bacterium]MBL8104209.1 helix-turn-helix transcriptional regulator [Anaerolineales bacterium]MCC7189002.1 helix-turn-helix transcriptional regulator [Anaerolineales bacterium]